MTEEENKSNTFAQMEANKKPEEPVVEKEVIEESEELKESEEPVKSNTEIDITDLSDTAVGDKKAYVRPGLDGKEDVVAKFQLFPVDTNSAPSESQNKNCKFWKMSAVLTYESKNDDGVNNREYISGARCFMQKDGSASEPSFWYKDAAKQTQISKLWEKVASVLKLEDPSKMSPRQFVAFLNNKPKVKIEAVEYDNFGAAPGSPKTIKKNMPGEFLA